MFRCWIYLPSSSGAALFLVRHYHFKGSDKGYLLPMQINYSPQNTITPLELKSGST